MPNILKTIKPFVVKHEPDILMYMGLAGIVGAVIMTVKSTVDAVDRLNALKEELNKEKLPKKEVFKTVWKCYIPPLILATVSIPCIIAGNRVSNKRNAALAAAYTISETALQEYQDKTKEIVGEKKEQKIREETNKEMVEKAYKQHGTTLIAGNGENLFYDELSGRFFSSTWNRVLKSANELNAAAIGGRDTITLNEWYEAIGLDEVQLGEERGWSIYNDGARGLVKISLTSILTSENIPCAAIHYENRPYELK